MPISDLLYKCVWGLGCGFPEVRTQLLRSSVIPEPGTAQDTADVRASELKSPPTAPQLASPVGLELQPEKPQGNVPMDPSREGARTCCATPLAGS